MALRVVARVALAAPAAPAELAAIVALAALAAARQRGRAALVVLAWRAQAALVAVAARAAPASMPSTSVMAPLVVMREQVAPVALAAPQARWAQTLRRWSVVLAGAAVTPVLRALARRVSAA